MFRQSHALRRVLGASLFSVLLISGATYAQAPPKSTALAQELAKLLDASKLEAIAAPGSEPDRFVAALYFPGTLLVVSAKYSVPVLLVEKLQKKDYREVYIDLSSASIPDSKTFVQDVGADGLIAERETGADSYDHGAMSWVFNGEWRKQKMASEEEYKKHYAAADAEYAQMLTALIAQAKK